MRSFVLDCALTMTWCFQDETSDYSDRVLDYLGSNSEENQAMVPSLWSLEVVNVLRVAEKTSRLSEAESLHFLDLLSNLPIKVDIEPLTPKDVLMIARSYQLTSYDASYLLLALRYAIPLATLDSALKSAAQKANIPLLKL
jgi:predicted nucleic acid-binding protein